jgi:pullulanase/glycogen debranching enzyme
MSTEANHSNFLGDLQQQSERELFTALLYSEDVTLKWNSDEASPIADVEVTENPKSKITYPIDPSDPAAENFFNQLDDNFNWVGWDNSEIEQRSQTFYQHLDQLWAVTPLQVALTKKFVTVPQTLLSAIARKVQQLTDTSNSLADQLLLCVNDILPQWAPEDLQVLARPLAYAMRSEATSAVDSALNSIRPLEWHELSEVEQARMSLAIARYAIDKVNDQAS